MKAMEMLYPGMYRGASLERKEKTAMMPPTVRACAGRGRGGRGRSVRECGLGGWRVVGTYRFRSRPGRLSRPLVYGVRPLHSPNVSITCGLHPDRALTIRIEPTHDDRHGRVRAHRSKEERAVLQVPVVVHDEEDDEARERDRGRREYEHVAHPQPVRRRRGEHRECERARPRRDGEQLRADLAVPEALDDRRREVRCGRGRGQEGGDVSIRRAACERLRARDSP